MKGSPGMSSTRRAALMIKRKAIKTQNTKKNSRKPSTGTQKASSSGQRKKAPKLFWILIGNVHEKVAYNDIVQGIFQQCVKLSSKSDPSGHFQGNIKVAFETKKDAEEAVSRFSSKIIFFRKIWRIDHYRRSDVSPSSSLRNLDTEDAVESFDDRLGNIRKMVQDVAFIGVNPSAKINITNMDEEVPIKVVEPLFKTVGRVKGYEVFKNSDGIFEGTVELERIEDAVAAVELFHDNINFFGRTWFLTCKELFWITLSNIHEKVACERIVWALFQRCVKVKNKSAVSSSGGHLEGCFEVGFETKEDAEEAVNKFQNKIRILGKMWRIHHHRISDAASSSSLRISDIEESESSGDGPANLRCIGRAAAIGIFDSPKVRIANIDERVPIEVVKLLFKLAGVVSSFEVSNNPDDIFPVTVEIVYEQNDEAKAAVRLFFDNITFFGKTWSVMRKDLHDDDNDDDEDDSGPLSSTGSVGRGPLPSTASTGN